jgi:hypothetical protein
MDALTHYGSIATEHLLTPGVTPSAPLLALVEFVQGDRFGRNLGWGLGLACLLGAAAVGVPRVLTPGRRDPPNIDLLRRRLGGGLLVLAVIVNGALLGWWAAHRRTVVEETKAALAVILDDSAVVFGALAPLLVQDTNVVGVPYFTSLTEEDLLEKYGVTHLLVGLPRDLDEYRTEYPGLLARLEFVQGWSFRTRFLRRVELYRLPATTAAGAAYAPTPFERAVAALRSREWERALELFAEYRRTGGNEIADLFGFESDCLSALGRHREAEGLLRAALHTWPTDPALLKKSGILALLRRDDAAARAAFLRALREDPYDTDLVELLQRSGG